MHQNYNIPFELTNIYYVKITQLTFICVKFTQLKFVNKYPVENSS